MSGLLLIFFHESFLLINRFGYETKNNSNFKTINDTWEYNCAHSY